MKKINVEEHVVNLPEGVETSLIATNAYRIKCEPTGFNQTYTLCQHIVNAKRKGTLDKMKSCAPCTVALSKVECPAIHMMVAEKKAGRVLYYEHYDPSVVNFPEKPIRETKEIARSWFNKDMLIPTVKVEETECSQNAIMTINSPIKESTTQQEKPKVNSTPESIDNIYAAGMKEAFKNESSHNATI